MLITLGNNEYEYFIFDKDGKVGNMTIEVKDGEEYLAFETASFSPFNVGGTSNCRAWESTVRVTSHLQEQEQAVSLLEQSGQQQSQQNNPSSGQNNASQSSQETSVPEKPGNQTVSSAGSSNVTIIHTVKQEMTQKLPSMCS